MSCLRISNYVVWNLVGLEYTKESLELLWSRIVWQGRDLDAQRRLVL